MFPSNCIEEYDLMVLSSGRAATFVVGAVLLVAMWYWSFSATVQHTTPNQCNGETHGTNTQPAQPTSNELREWLTNTFPTTNMRLMNLPKVAMIMPFPKKQLSCVLYVLRLWSNSSLTPCGAATRKDPKFDLVYYFHKDITDPSFIADVQEPVLRLLEELPMVRACFKDIRWLGANLTDYEDMYKVGEVKARGANNMFYRLFLNRTKEDLPYNYFLLYEPDIRPIKPHWLDRALEEIVVETSDFWVKGSVGKIPTHIYNSMNGNAFYKLHDEKFNSYLNTVWAAHGEQSYDTSLWEYTQKREHWEMNSKFKHRYIFTDFVNDQVTAEKYPDDYSTTHLVHVTGGHPRGC